ncbi:MAG TPA: hypothetical protein VGB71_12885 [Flavisolibacter sp.]|jgi:hypothetical protein
MKKRNQIPFYKIAIIVLLILGAVYALSQYTRRHEIKTESSPAPAGTTLGRDGEAK